MSKAQKLLAGSVATASTFWAGIAPLPARAYSYTANIQCGNQGWILKSNQDPGVDNPTAVLISQGNSVNGTYNSGDQTYVFEGNSFEYQVVIQDDRRANLRILNNQGEIVSDEECTYRN